MGNLSRAPWDATLSLHWKRNKHGKDVEKEERMDYFVDPGYDLDEELEGMSDEDAHAWWEFEDDDDDDFDGGGGYPIPMAA